MSEPFSLEAVERALGADVARRVARWMALSLDEDSIARLVVTTAGEIEGVSLAQIYQDLELHRDSSERIESDEAVASGFYAMLHASNVDDTIAALPGNAGAAASAGHRWVLFGGPGQGKSTLTQWAAITQWQRLLRSANQHTVESLIALGIDGERAKKIAQKIEDIERRAASFVAKPNAPWLALRIDLPRFVEFTSSCVDGDRVDAVCAFLASLRGETVTAGELRACCERWPVLWLFDALDEVALADARSLCVHSMHDCLLATAPQSRVVVTSRPQGFDGALSAERREQRASDAPSESHSSWTALYVRALSRSQVKAIVDSLLSKAFDDQPAERRRVEGAVDRELAHPDVARLFRTPLFVSILLRLIDSHDALPTSRSALFDRLYDVLLARESRKNVGSVRRSLLERYAWAVTALHERVALLLHVRADSTGASRGVATDELRRIAEQVVRERVSNARAKEQLVADLLFFAEQRLVLLAQYELGSVRFDVQLVQEYFASRALFSPTVAVELRSERLRAIAPHASWRQVLIFAASVWADSNDEALIDALIACCRAANDESGKSGPCELGFLRMGTEIAVAVLQAGAFDSAPDAAGRLWHCALEGEWERSFWAGDVWAAVAQRFASSNPELRQRLFERIEETNTTSESTSHIEPALSLWKQFGDEAARAVIERCARANSRVASGLLHRCSMQPDRLLPLLLALLDQPLRVDPMQGSLLAEERLFAPDWLQCWHRLFEAEQVRMREFEIDGLRVLVQLRELGQGVGLSAEEIEQMLLHVDAPAPWRLYFDFHLAPSIETLASLVEFSGDENGALVRALAFARRCAWPAAGLLQELFASNASPIALAQRVRAGEFGDREDWIACERIDPANCSLREWNSSVRWLWLRGSSVHFVQIRGLRAESVREGREAIESRSPAAALLFARMLDTGLRHEAFASLSLSADDLAWLATFVDAPQYSWDEFVSREQLDAFLRSLSARLVRRPQCFLPQFHTMGASRGKEQVFRSLLQSAAPEEAIAEYRLLEVHWDHQVPTSWPAQLRALPRPRVSPEAWASIVFRCPEVEGERLTEAIAVLTAPDPISEHYLQRSVVRLVHALPGPTKRDADRRWVERMVALLAASQTTHPWLRYERSLSTLLHSLVRRRPGPFSPDEITRMALPILPSLSTQPAMTVSPVTLQHIAVRNLRSIESVEIAPPLTRPDRGQWIVLLGDNGVGKTSILRGIALALVEPRFATPGPESDSLRLVRASQRSGEARVRFRFRDHDRETRCDLSVDEENVEGWKYTDENDRPFVVAYGVFRTALDGASSSVVDEPKAIRSLFDQSHTLVSARHWLNTLEEDEVGVVAGSLRAALAEALIPVGVTDVRISVTHGFTFTGPAVGSEIALHHLSDGFQSAIAWVVDVMARWFAATKRARRPIERDFHKQMIGVVLVDEIDQHLHPLWQRDLVQSLRSVFPKLTFVATTHNPLTVVELNEGELFRVHRDDVGKVCVDPLPSVRGKHADDVLTGSWFGLGSTLDDETLRWMEEHRRMLRDRPEDPARGTLEEKIRHRTTRYAELAIERIALGVAQEIMDEEAKLWEQPERSSPEQRAELRAALLQRVRDKLKDRRPPTGG